MAKRDKLLKIKIENMGQVKVHALGKNERFTVGHHPKNSLLLYGKDSPKKFDLVSGRGDTFILTVRENMIGEVVLDNTTLSIQDLIKHKLLRRTKHGYLLALTKGKKASIKLNDVRFQFEYNGLADVQLNGAAYWTLKHRVVKRMTTDILFKAVLSVFLVLGSAFGYYVYGLPYVAGKKINLDKYARHVARVVLKPITKNPGLPEPSKESTKSLETDKRKKNEDEPSKPEIAEKAPETPKPSVSKQGLLGLIGGTGKNDNPSMIIETLMDKGLVQEINEILESGQNLEIELPSLADLGNGLDDALSVPDLDVDNLISEMRQDESIELQENGEVDLQSLESIEGNGSALGLRDERSILRVFNSYRGRITYAYNKILKQDPGLRGKVVLEITVDASGKVTKCVVASSTLANPSFEQELVRIVKNMRFQSIPEGEVTFQNPFVFFRQDT